MYDMQPSASPPKRYVARNMERIEYFLATGCDERIYLNNEGLNRYWLNPARYENLVHRGSCTCGTLNDENLALMDALLDQDLTETKAYESQLENQTGQLKELINYDGEDRFEVFYGPSGSDLAYLPIFFGRILHPGRPVLNIVSCPEELGSGTLHAVKGEYHAAFNQFDQPVRKGQAISGDVHVDTLFLNARSREGKIINHEAYIKEQIAAHPAHSIIVSLVYGSKSGIEDNLDLIDKVDRPDIIWSVDMCQFRHSRKIIHRLLDKNACVMITGSKFYQAPPFCGCMLVSKEFMASLSLGDLAGFSSLEKVFSAYDFPVAIRQEVQLPWNKNIGLRLRWACSLNEIAKFREIPKMTARAKIEEWNAFIMSRLELSNAFEPMPDQGKTNKTIISFRVKRGGRYLDHKQLKALFQLTVCTGRLSGPVGKQIFIGQPVAYGSRSFLRVAIGSMCIREFIESDEHQFAEDAEILRIIESKISELETA